MYAYKKLCVFELMFLIVLRHFITFVFWEVLHILIILLCIIYLYVFSPLSAMARVGFRFFVIKFFNIVVSRKINVMLQLLLDMFTKLYFNYMALFFQLYFLTRSLASKLSGVCASVICLKKKHLLSLIITRIRKSITFFIDFVRFKVHVIK